MIFFVFVCSLIIAAALDVSEPVPAVVGMAIIGLIFSVLIILFFAMDSKNLFSDQKLPSAVKSQSGLFTDANNAIDLPTSKLLPPPMAITPS